MSAVCRVCGALLSGRQRTACSPAHRTELSRLRRILDGEDVEGYSSAYGRLVALKANKPPVEAISPDASPPGQDEAPRPLKPRRDTESGRVRVSLTLDEARALLDERDRGVHVSGASRRLLDKIAAGLARKTLTARTRVR